MASVTTTQAAIESIEDVVKWGLRHIPTANPAHQATLQVACAAMELCLKFRINKEDVLATGEMIARITRSIVFQGVPDDQVIHLDDLTIALANTHVYLEETFESTKGWNILMDKSQRETHAKSIASRMMQYQDDIQRTACFLQVDFDIQIVGSVDDLMQDMQAMMVKLEKMDYYISLAQNDGALNRQVDNLLEMAIQLQRGLDYYHHNVSLRNVQTNRNFEASVLTSFDKVVHAANNSWRASKITHDLPLNDMLEEWMLASEDIVYNPSNKSKFLGQGASAMVYLGHYKGRSVAVKHFHTLKLADSTEFETMIRKEIKAWRDVSNEPYILTLIGVCTKIASPIVVCEYCPDTITRYIRLHPEKLIEMVYQFALGLLSLHSAGIIHRDIKGGNVLVREDGTVAIADFGLSRSTESLLTQYSNAGRFVGTLNWMSPEQRFSPRKVTVQSDVWSFGMTVWQLLTGDIPYRDYCHEEIEDAIRTEDERPARPQELSSEFDQLWKLITLCWQLNSFERPKAVDIVGFLEYHYIHREKIQMSSKSVGEPVTIETVIMDASELATNSSANSEIPTNLTAGNKSLPPDMHSEATKSNATFQQKNRNKTSKPSIWKKIVGVFSSNKPAKQKKQPFGKTVEQIIDVAVDDVPTLKPGSKIDEDSQINNLTPIRLDERELTLEKSQPGSQSMHLWLGKYHGVRVAIHKVRLYNPTSYELKPFIESILLLSRLDSPYIVKLIGAAWDRPTNVMCVTEWMDGYTLRRRFDRADRAPFSWQAKQEVMYHIVEALAYLHSMGVIHRDIQSSNVMLDSTKPAKLKDVNTSKDHAEVTMTFGVGIFRWMAPEVIRQDEEVTVAADIYSFGVVLSEFDTHLVPYEDMRNPVNGRQIHDTMIMIGVTTGELLPTFTSECPEWIHKMAMQCLSLNPNDRPTAQELVKTMRSNLTDL
ncbi:hypothetical protein AC1031_011035 [Aphanomyces cochlioides]|nr:hypothetical protein AC1031_011035 [Aphanomyces cochlioides]